MPNRFTVNAVGDISLGDHPVCVGHGMRTAFAHRRWEILNGVRELLEDADLTVGNLETVASNIGLRRHWLPSYEMRGHPDSLQFLKNAGINTLSIANNHIMQHGGAVFFDTVNNLRALHFNVIGLADAAAGMIPATFQKHGVGVCMVSASLRPEVWAAGTPPYSQFQSEADIIANIRELRRQLSGFLICSLHWGLEFLDYPGPSQVSLAHRLIEAGADVILGHHSHVLQPVERYRSGLIFYSLGNFTFDLWHEDMKLGVIARIHLHNEQNPTYSLRPVAIGNDFTVNAATSSQDQIIRSIMSETRLLMGSPASTPDEYLKQYLRKAMLNRRSSHKYFIRNINAYSPNFIAQSLTRTAYRRLIGR